MKKLIVTVGISGSGKSTWANQQFLNNPDTTIIVNRDKIRELLFGYTEQSIENYYALPNISKHEKQVTNFENTLIKEGLAFGKTVIVDSTNLTTKYLERYKYFNVETELKFFDIDMATAIQRDIKRTREVGEKVIKKQYGRFNSLLNNLLKKDIDFTPYTIKQDPTLRPCYIFDIDGTLAKKHKRSPYEWHRVEEDTCYNSVAQIAEIIHKTPDADVIICTGRDGVCEKETKAWLDDYEISFNGFYIRKEKDFRPDWIVKEEMWKDISKKYNILGMFDDRNQVVDRARSLGLKVFQVEYHNF